MTPLAFALALAGTLAAIDLFAWGSLALLRLFGRIS